METSTGASLVQVGYAQGTVQNPTYSEVCGGKTGHTEAVQVRRDFMSALFLGHCLIEVC